MPPSHHDLSSLSTQDQLRYSSVGTWANGTYTCIYTRGTLALDKGILSFVSKGGSQIYFSLPLADIAQAQFGMLQQLTLTTRQDDKYIVYLGNSSTAFLMKSEQRGASIVISVFVWLILSFVWRHETNAIGKLKPGNAIKAEQETLPIAIAWYKLFKQLRVSISKPQQYFTQSMFVTGSVITWLLVLILAPLVFISLT